MHSETDWGRPQHQSRVVILLALFRMFKTLFTLFALLMARFVLNKGSVSNKQISEIFWVLSAVTFLYFIIRINDIARYFFYRFYLADNQLIVESGMIIKKKTVVPLHRIQAIHTSQTLLHKLTYTCKLAIDTAGSEKTEIEIEALHLGIAQAFTRVVSAQGTVKAENILGEKGQRSEAHQFLRFSFKDLLKLCLSENHLKTFLIVVAFLVGKMQDIRDYLGFDSLRWAEKYSRGLNPTIQGILIIFILGMFVSVLVSCIRVILRFYGFAIRLQQADLLMKWGFLETRQKHILFKNVQMLSWRSTFMRRLLGMSILRLHAIAEDESKEEQRIQAPITNMSQVITLAGYYQPVLPSGNYPHLTIQKKFVLRQILLIGLPVAIIGAFSLSFFMGWYALLTLVWLLYFCVSSYLYRKYFKIWISNEAIQIEKGVWGRENILVNFKNIQQVTVKTSPYKRTHELADIQLHTTGLKINIPFLQKSEASFMADFILANIEFPYEISQLTADTAAKESVTDNG